MRKKWILGYLLYFPSFCLLAQVGEDEMGYETEVMPIWDYWPVLLLPIFGFMVYKFWKKRNK